MSIKKWVFGFFMGSLLPFSFAATNARPPANTSTSSNPSNVMNTLEETLPGSETPKKSSFTIEKTPQAISQINNSQSQFVLQQVQLLGAEYPVPANVTKLYQAEIGQKIGIQDVQNLAAKMEQAYRDDGYILVQVILPPQEIALEKGVVKFQVVEGQIQNVIFSGDSAKGAEAQLERYADAIEEEDPITYQTIDRFLTLANQLPGIDVSATLVPNKTVMGAADLLISVKQTPVSAFINFNNRGTQYIGPGQASAGASIYDIFGADSLSITGATSTSSIKELTYGSISYDLVAGPYATEINPNITTTETTPGNSLAPFEMYGVSTKYDLNVNQPLFVSTPQNLTLQSSFYHLDSFNSIFQSEQLYQDNITALSVGLDYQGIFFGQTYNDINLSSTLGTPIFGAPLTPSNPSITNGKTEFVKLNLNTTQIHYFTNRISMNLGTQTQLTPQTMLASEQIGYGGQSFGQAFIPYVISGDNGVMGSLALRYDLPAPAAVKLLQPEVFYDIGSVWLNQPPSGGSGGASAQSAGIGLNVQLLDQWQLNLTLAKPLKITQTAGVPMGWQAFFNLTGVF